MVNGLQGCRQGDGGLHLQRDQRYLLSPLERGARMFRASMKEKKKLHCDNSPPARGSSPRLALAGFPSPQDTEKTTPVLPSSLQSMNYPAHLPRASCKDYFSLKLQGNRGHVLAQPQLVFKQRVKSPSKRMSTLLVKYSQFIQ